jgi:hypothetical protein
VVRLGALALAVLLFYSTDWAFLRRLCRSAVGPVLVGLGHRTVASDSGGSIGLAVDGERFSISPDCTYVDLALVLAPFWWRSPRSVTSNLGRIAAGTAVVLGLNLLRITLAMHGLARGQPMWLVHDLPDLLVYWPVIGASVLLALRHDARGRGIREPANPAL